MVLMWCHQEQSVKILRLTLIDDCCLQRDGWMVPVGLERFCLIKRWRVSACAIHCFWNNIWSHTISQMLGVLGGGLATS